MLNNQDNYIIEVTPSLCSYVSDYINEELNRGASIDKYTIQDAFDAFLGGASIESTNEE